jgi:Icc-related predicted phosphoesterase
MKVVALSDTHGYHRKISVPDGDILIHAGDITSRGEMSTLEDFNLWLGELPHRYKICIAGNHDFSAESNPELWRKTLTNSFYLVDESVEIDGFVIWGSPYQPWFHNWAFNLPRGEKLKEKWKAIPSNVDILLTHTPPFGVLDEVDGRSVGCQDLRNRLNEVTPKVHIFGHIHEGYGEITQGKTKFINASICDVRYFPCNEARVFEL